MPRFFFHLHNDMDVLDEEGRDMPSVQAARHAAEEDARTMAAESVRTGRLVLDHFIEVASETGQALFRVRFGEVVEVR
jgi:hypothetical protein